METGNRYWKWKLEMEMKAKKKKKRTNQYFGAVFSSWIHEQCAL